mmetsp:Transcript_23695/g.43011  ORF Transcript_23695/g.43011 Transcript_23695/m.43011 type:complete len:180 (+) Transcript_23695:267-806(+)
MEKRKKKQQEGSRNSKLVYSTIYPWLGVMMMVRENSTLMPLFNAVGRKSMPLEIQSFNALWMEQIQVRLGYDPFLTANIFAYALQIYPAGLVVILLQRHHVSDEEVSLEDEAQYDSDRVLRLLTCRGWLDVEEFIRDKQGNYPSDDDEDGDSSIGKTRLAGMSSFVSKKMLVRGTYGEP